MSFKYSEDWAEELVTLYRNANSIEDDERLYELLDAVEDCSDIKLVQPLIECLEIGIDGIDQTVYGVLASIDYPIYYEGVFAIVNKYLDEGTDLSEETKAYVAMEVLDWQMRELTDEEYNKVVFPIVEKYLSVQQAKKYLIVLESRGVPEEYNDNKAIISFYHFFKKMVKEQENE